jgi:site-specific DNA-cytosine methylase
VVSPWDRGTFCFTGGYGKVINVSSGSFLLHRGHRVDAGQALAAHPLDKSQGLGPYAGCMRFFSPMELLRLFGFPHWYRFPPHFTVVHAYKLIGNSINIGVVRLILQHHLAPCLPQAQAQAK